MLLVETGSQESTVRAGLDGRDTVQAGRSVRAGRSVQASPCSAVCERGSLCRNGCWLCFFFLFNLSPVSHQEPVRLSRYLLPRDLHPLPNSTPNWTVNHPVLGANFLLCTEKGVWAHSGENVADCHSLWCWEASQPSSSLLPQRAWTQLRNPSGLSSLNTALPTWRRGAPLCRLCARWSR